jgi:hypothetical protein
MPTAVAPLYRPADLVPGKEECFNPIILIEQKGFNSLSKDEKPV